MSRFIDPLRLIVARDALYDHLECGHSLSNNSSDAIYRRRCFKCRLGRPADEHMGRESAQSGRTPDPIDAERPSHR